MQVDGRVREVGVAEQDLNRAQVRARFEEVGGVRMAQRLLTLLMNPLLPSSTTATIRITARR